MFAEEGGTEILKTEMLIINFCPRYGASSIYSSRVYILYIYVYIGKILGSLSRYRIYIYCTYELG